MQMLKKINQFFCRIEEFTLSYGVILLTIITVGNVVSRKVFNHSWSFAEEISQFILVIVTFMGVGYAARKSRHIRMTAVYEMMPEKVKKALMLFISLTTTLLFLYLAWHAWGYTERVISSARVTPVLRVPFYLVIMWVPIGMFMGAVQYGLTFLKNLTHQGIWLSFEEQSEYKDL
jgi:TRAP-type C4-dicarboxylate transport system permease small subunit